VKMSDGAILRYQFSVKSGYGPLRGIQLSSGYYDRSASANKRRIAVLKNVATKMLIIMAVISEVSVW
jgi:hypothetical protein